MFLWGLLTTVIFKCTAFRFKIKSEMFDNKIRWHKISYIFDKLCECHTKTVILNVVSFTGAFNASAVEFVYLLIH